MFTSTVYHELRHFFIGEPVMNGIQLLEDDNWKMNETTRTGVGDFWSPCAVHLQLWFTIINQHQASMTYISTCYAIVEPPQVPWKQTHWTCTNNCQPWLIIVKHNLSQFLLNYSSYWWLVIIDYLVLSVSMLNQHQPPLIGHEHEPLSLANLHEEASSLSALHHHESLMLVVD